MEQAGTLSLNNNLEEMLSSYEGRVQTIGSMFDTTHLVLGELQESLVYAKDERGKIHTQLRDVLARNEHLRKKDFDNMMRDILFTQEQREKEARNLLRNYVFKQKEMAHVLREGMTAVKDALARRETARVREFQLWVKEILAEQDRRKEEVISRLKEFQREQQELGRRLKELLAKGSNLRIKDLKLMLKAFSAQRKERIALQEARRQEVRELLGGFKKARLERTGK